jgi:hypothetical protein
LARLPGIIAIAAFDQCFAALVKRLRRNVHSPSTLSDAGLTRKIHAIFTIIRKAIDFSCTLSPPKLQSRTLGAPHCGSSPAIVSSVRQQDDECDELIRASFSVALSLHEAARTELVG